MSPLLHIPIPMRNQVLPYLGALFAFIPLSIGQDTDPGPTLPDGIEAHDWQAIKTAHQLTEHQPYASNGLLHARNTRQGWLTTFDGEGFLVKPRSSGWSWGLKLESYGFNQTIHHVEGQAEATIDGDTIRYDWNANVQEWYVNGALGLEHGYTIRERPAQGRKPEAPLVFDLTIRGSLHAEILNNQKGVRFLDEKGASVVTYTGLHVFDANGVTQPASFVESGAGVRISIAESEATYPLTIDPIAQQAYLKASNTQADDRFGGAVAASGNIVVVGAIREDSNATGVDGDQSDNSLTSSGAAYVFERIGGVWSQQAYLKASNPGHGDSFGVSVAVSGDTVVVGALFEESLATGINGNQASNNMQGAGAAYIFERVGGIWTQQVYLKAYNTGYQDYFGASMAMHGDTLIIGAPGEASSASGVNGNHNDNSMADAGAAYVFQRSGGTWNQQAYLKASNPDAGDRFGTAVALSSDQIIVGAYREGSSATGVDGNQSDNSTFEAGAAYVFERIGGIWTQQAYLKAPVNNVVNYFGRSVAISDDLAVVASRRNGAVVFEKSAPGWTYSTQLEPVNSSSLSVGSVAVFDDQIFMGSLADSLDSSGINDPTGTSVGGSVGGVYSFKHTQGVWEQKAYLKPHRTAFYYVFGEALALTSDLIVVGASGDPSSATGVNGDPNQGDMQQSGAAYIYDLNASQTNYCGSGIPNSSGQSGKMSMSGSFVTADNSFTLHATDLPTGQFGYFLNSMGQGYVPNPGGSQGYLCLGGSAPMGRHNRAGEVGFSGASGQISLTLDLNNMPTPSGSSTVMAGEQWNFQCWHRDLNPGSTSNFTDGLWVQFE